MKSVSHTLNKQEVVSLLSNSTALRLAKTQMFLRFGHSESAIDKNKTSADRAIYVYEIFSKKQRK